MTMVDLRPAAQRLADLIAAVPEDRLDGPTPCPDYRLADLVDHVRGLAQAFTAAAVKDLGGLTDGAPPVSGSQLEEGWRERIPADLAAMAEAWRDPEAWTGMTRAGGIDLPGEAAGIVALDELVLHGWDVARASGAEYTCDQSSLEAVHGFVQQFSGPGQEDQREGLFGPVVPVPESAPLLDRVLGMAGRDPSWSPA